MYTYVKAEVVLFCNCYLSPCDVKLTFVPAIISAVCIIIIVIIVITAIYIFSDKN